MEKVLLVPVIEKFKEGVGALVEVKKCYALRESFTKNSDITLGKVVLSLSIEELKTTIVILEEHLEVLKNLIAESLGYRNVANDLSLRGFVYFLEHLAEQNGIREGSDCPICKSID